MDIDNSKLEGQLKFVLENGEEKDIIKNETLFGEFKLKYIPPEKYFDLGFTESFFPINSQKFFNCYIYYSVFNNYLCS